MFAGVWFWMKQQVGVEIRRGRYVVSTGDRSREYKKGTQRCSVELLCDWGNVAGETEGEEKRSVAYLVFCQAWSLLEHFM